MMRSHLHLATPMALLVLLLTLLLASPTTPVRGQDTPTPTARPTQTIGSNQLSADAILTIAERTSADASRAVESANTILTLIQSFGALIGLLVAVVGLLGALLGFRTLTDFNKTRATFNDEMVRALDRLRAFEQRIEQDTRTVRDQGENAIRALTLLQLGKQQMDARNLDAALTTLLQAKTFDLDNRAINYFLGELYIQMDDLNRGIENLRLAGAETPIDDLNAFPAAKAAYAYAWRRKGDREKDHELQTDHYHKAEGYFREALRRNPKLLDIAGESFYGALGGLYQRQGRFADAVACYEKAIEATNSTSSYPYNNLGILYTRLRNAVKAKEYFEKAVRAATQTLDDKPLDYWARFDMVTAQAMLENDEALRTHLPLALQSAPTAEKLNTLLGGLRILIETAPNPTLVKTSQIVEDEISRRERQAMKNG
jgi:tetratricopeptide (TPR) repeat protein